jgi:Arc/MetJ family transcription regulator
MRTTVDIDEDLHAEAQAAARRSRTSVSGIVNEALRKALRPAGPVERDPLTGFGVVDLGYEVTADNVADVLDD